MKRAMHMKRWSWTRAATIAVAGLAVLTSDAADAEEYKPVYRGSSLVYRNAFNTLSLDESAEPNYDPYYAMSLSAAPRLWWNDMLWVGSSFSMTRELTQPNATVDQGELILSDLNFTLGASRFVTIPYAEIDISGDLGLTLPMSPFSKAQTLRYAVSPGLSLSRSFKLLSGLRLGYGIRATLNDHRFTTSARESAVIDSCAPTDSECARFLNTGVRNSQWRLSQNFSVGLSPIDDLSLSAGLGLSPSFLYDAADLEDVSLQPQEAENERYSISYQLALAYQITAPLSATLGMTTFNPQLAPDSTYYEPVFNRYTQIYVDLGIDIAALVSEFQF